MRKRHALAALISLNLIASVACHKSDGVPGLALEECDPAGYVPCVQQTAFLSVPVVDTNLFLTYSSRWRASRPSQQGVWDAQTLGLGGWAIDLVQHYDQASRLLFSGDGSWRIADSVALPSGERAVPSYDGKLAYVFDTSGRHLRTLDTYLGTEMVRVSYDGAGRLAKLDGVADGQPVHLSVQRDPSGRAIALVGIDGAKTALQMDDDGRLSAATNPAGQTTRMEWNATGLVESEIDPAGGVTKFTYDTAGRLGTWTDPDGVVQHFDQNSLPKGIEIRVSTPQNRHWSYRAESTGDGIRRTFVARDGTSVTETIDSHSARTLKLADGTRYSVGAISHPVWGMAAPIMTPIVQTRPDGVTSRREIRYSLRPESAPSYSLAGSMTTIINGQAWTQNFDPVQHTQTLTDPLGRRTASKFDEQSRIVSFAAPGAAPVFYTYNAEGRLLIQTVGTGKFAHVMHYAYRPDTGEIIITRPDGVIEKSAVNRVGQVVTTTAGDGSITLANYNAAGMLIQLQPPARLNYTLGSSSGGRATAFAPPMVEGDASVEMTSYDKDGQLTAIFMPGDHTVNLGYDTAGRVASWAFDAGKRTVAYDDHSGLVRQASDPSGITTSYGYTGNLPDRLAWSGPVNGSVSFSLDANGRASSETVNGADRLSFAYDGAGNLTGVGALSLTRDDSGLVTQTEFGAIKTDLQFDDNRQLVRTTTHANGRTLLDQHYTRDSLGRINRMTETDSAGKTSTVEYSYDRGDRLASIRVNGGSVETNAYDPAGNRIGVLRPTGKLQASFDVRDRTSKWGATQYLWTPNGNLRRRIDNNGGGTSFTYDDFGALRGVTLPDGRKITYLVDAEGRRVGREVDGKLVTGYLYRPDGSIAAEVDSAGKLVARFGYDEEGHLALVERSGVTYRVITDTLGSPRLILDTRNGAVAAEMSYDAWGNLTRDSAPAFVPFGFAGGLRDSDTGLVRFGARDYEPSTGRWTAADPIRFEGGDANLYRYAGGDPVNHVDRTGLFFPFSWVPPPIALGYGLMWGYRHLSAPSNPPPNGTPPSNGSPSSNGNPPPNNSGSWNCTAVQGMCGSPGRGPKNSWGCENGSCGGDRNGFWCDAAHCFGPNGDLCVGAARCTGSWADPHLRNGEGMHFDFQTAGEFLAAASPGGKHVVQARQEPLFGIAGVTFNTAVAANVDGDRVGIYTREPSFLMLNGTPLVDGDIAERHLPHGGMLERHGGIVNLRWQDGSELAITQIGITLNYSFAPNPDVAGRLLGVLGEGSGLSSTTLIGRDGRVLSATDPAFQTKLYSQFGSSWRIRQSESLFYYWPGESTAKFANLNMPLQRVEATTLSPDVHSRAETVCRAVGVRTQPTLDDCILDVGLTGMPAFAASSAGVAAAPNASLAAMSASRAATPTPTTSPAHSDQFSIRIGDTVGPDKPSSGAGIINHPEQNQVYSFTAHAGEIVYLGVGPCEGSSPKLELLNPDNSLLDLTLGCRDLGRAVLTHAGNYQIRASAEKTSRYNFFLREVPADQHFTLRLPFTVSPDAPSPGAGHISVQGSQQFFDFTASPGSVVHIESKCSCPNLSVRAVGLGDTSRFGYFDLNHLNDDWKLPAGGSYTVQVRSNGYTGNYSFTVSAAGPQRH